MRVTLRFKDDVSILTLSGKFVAGSDGPFLRQKVQDLIEAGTRKFLFDFGEVPYIDSTGLGFLAGSRELAVDASAVIVLSGMNPHVRRILDGVKLSQFFDLVEDEEAGLARIKQLSRAAATAKSEGTPRNLEATKSARARRRPAGAPE